MRVALLPFSGDPMLLQWWMGWFWRWSDDVDKLIVHLNANIPDEARVFCAFFPLKHPKVVFMESNENIGHGESLAKMIKTCHDDDVLMFIEEDGFVFKRGMMDECFRWIERGQFDIVGSHRGSCSEEICKTAEIKWGTGEPNFWPNFFFCKKSLLNKTDGNFGTKHWEIGEEVVGLGITAQEPLNGDTFVSASLQLRGLGPRIKLIEQYHGYPHDIESHSRHENIWDGRANWFHAGSLSSWKGILMTDKLDDFGCSTEEWERRCQMWLTFWEESDPTAVPIFREKYKQGIDRLISQYKLSLETIKFRQRIYRELWGSLT